MVPPIVSAPPTVKFVVTSNEPDTDVALITGLAKFLVLVCKALMDVPRLTELAVTVVAVMFPLAATFVVVIDGADKVAHVKSVVTSKDPVSTELVPLGLVKHCVFVLSEASVVPTFVPLTVRAGVVMLVVAVKAPAIDVAFAAELVKFCVLVPKVLMLPPTFTPFTIIVGDVIELVAVNAPEIDDTFAAELVKFCVFVLSDVKDVETLVPLTVRAGDVMDVVAVMVGHVTDVDAERVAAVTLSHTRVAREGMFRLPVTVRSCTCEVVDVMVLAATFVEEMFVAVMLVDIVCFL